MRSALGAALRVAIIGSAAVALVETAAALWVSAAYLPSARWLAELAAAAYGKAALTHLMVWLPLLLLGAVVCGLIGRPKRPVPVDALLWAAFVFAAGCLVTSADLAMVQRASGKLIAAGCSISCVAGAAAYFAVRTSSRRLGPVRFRRALNVVATAVALPTCIAVVLFARSPLCDPADYSAPRGTPVRSAHGRPNVLWIVLDTTRADRMGCHGCAQPTTPFLDEWAARAAVFDLAIANGMWTVPAHASMFTGLSVREHGTGHHHLWLDDSFRTVADVLSAAGYATAMFSNNPLVSADTNLTQGFQTALDVYHLRHVNRFSLDSLCEQWGIAPPLPWLDQDSGAALTNSLVADWLDGRPDVPKFIFINYMEAHLPYRVPARYRRMFLDGAQVTRSYKLRQNAFGDAVRRLDRDFNIRGPDFVSPADREILRGQYDATIRYLDDRVRKVIELFAQRGLLDNTLVVIASDHGEHLDTHGLWGHRFLTYQDLAHVALLIREPGRDQGVRVATPVQLSDLYATVLDAVLPGSDSDPATRPAGCDLLALAREGGDEQRVAICECNGPAPDTMEHFKGVTDPVVLHRASPQIAAVGSRYKLIKSADGQRELYDLAEDPGEQHNLIDALPDEARRLGAYIRDWLEMTRAYTPPARSGQLIAPDVLEALRSLGYVDDDD